MNRYRISFAIEFNDSLAEQTRVFQTHFNQLFSGRCRLLPSMKELALSVRRRDIWGIVGGCFAVTLLAGCNAGLLTPSKATSSRQVPLGDIDERPTKKSDETPDISPELERRLNRIGMGMRLILAGRFAMGTADVSPFGDFATCEQPQHVVRLTRPFWMGECEVTVGQFRRFVGSTGYRTEAETTRQGVNALDLVTGEVVQHSDRIWKSPGFSQTDQHPVVGVSWTDAQKFCEWLSELEGQTYRLPTEAEWEYACRAGTKTAFASGESFSPSFGNVGDVSLRAAFSKASGNANWSDQFPFTAPVGSFQPNRFGLFDMHGNVGEWCQDWFDAEFYASSPEIDPSGPPKPTQWRVVRGGSWYNSPAHCRSAGRHDGLPTAPSTTNGFRVVMEANDSN